MFFTSNPAVFKEKPVQILLHYFNPFKLTSMSDAVLSLRVRAADKEFGAWFKEWARKKEAGGN